jgi:hypothetical protein
MGYRRMSFATPLKAMLWAFLTQAGCDTATAKRMIDGDLKEVPSTFFLGRSPRYAMQTLGTDWGRKLIGEGLWVSVTISAAQKARKAGHPVVIDDVRFPNEAEAITAAEGMMVRVFRPGRESSPEQAYEGNLEGFSFGLELENDAPSADVFASLASIVDAKARNWGL